MHQYRDRKNRESLTPVPDPPVQHAPATSRMAPTQFKVVNNCEFEPKHTVSSTVEAEYQRYSSGERTSKGTPILQFWEVSFL